jgi:hypothetical protein
MVAEGEGAAPSRTSADPPVTGRAGRVRGGQAVAAAAREAARRAPSRLRWSAMSRRRIRWTLAITAVVVEIGLFVAWRLWLRWQQADRATEP